MNVTTVYENGRGKKELPKTSFFNLKQSRHSLARKAQKYSIKPSKEIHQSTHCAFLAPLQLNSFLLAPDVKPGINSNYKNGVPFGGISVKLRSKYARGIICLSMIRKCHADRIKNDKFHRN